MSTRNFIIGGFILATAVSAILVYFFYPKYEYLPNFKFKQLNGQFFTKNNLKANTETMFVFFNTECEHCQEEASELQANAAKFKAYQVIMVAANELDSLKKFNNKYELSNFGAIVLQDEKMEAKKWFGVSDIPFTMLYDKKERLRVRFKGKAAAKNILKELESL
jgi:peroxiredoxin